MPRINLTPTTVSLQDALLIVHANEYEKEESTHTTVLVHALKQQVVYNVKSIFSRLGI